MEIDAKESKRNYYDCVLQKDKPQFRLLFVEYIYFGRKGTKERKVPEKS